MKNEKDMPPFTRQDKPDKVKDIYRALKREHPDMSAEYKARIAAKFGKKGMQKQGPPYKGPLTKTGEINKMATRWKKLLRKGELSPLLAEEKGLLENTLKKNIVDPKMNQRKRFVDFYLNRAKEKGLFKKAGGPGSGNSSDNTMEIGLPLSEYVSVGTRKALLENMPYKEEIVPIDKIKKVAQEKYVPEKLNRMLENAEEVLEKPIDLLKISDAEYHVIDGHHRYLIALKTGIKKIKAKVYERRKDMDKREKLVEKVAAELTTKAREDLPKSEFVYEKEEKYPISDLAHAKNALARVSQFGTPAEKEKVRKEVYAKYPELKESFKERHGESPTSEKNIQKKEQGEIGKTASEFVLSIKNQFKKEGSY